MITGTRIVYDRTFLLKYRSSELGKTPPTNLPEIPGVTVPEKKHEVKEETTPRPSGELQTFVNFLLNFSLLAN